MKGLMKTIVIFFCLLMMVNFEVYSQKARLNKRYKNINSSKCPDGFLVDLKAFSYPAEPKSSKLYFNKLPDKAQKAFIESVFQLNAHPNDSNRNVLKDPKRFIENLAIPIHKTKRPSKIDKTTIKRKLVFSVEDLNHIPGERIRFLKIRSVIEDVKKRKPARFITWDKIETKYAAVDLGKLSLETNTSIGLEGNLGLDTEVADNSDTSRSATFKSGASIKPSFTNSRKVTEDLVLKERYIDVSGYITDNSMVIIRESTMGIDLDGNLIVNFTIRLEREPQINKVVRLSNLFTGTTPNKSDQLDLFLQEAIYPIDAGDVFATLEMDYRFRKFQHDNEDNRRYQKTIPEFDDRICDCLKKDVKAGKTRLLSKNEYYVKPFELVINEKGNELKIHYKRPFSGNPPEPLFFETWEEAYQFLLWMNLFKKTLGANGLKNDVLVSKFGDSLYKGGMKKLKWSEVDKITIRLMN